MKENKQSQNHGFKFEAMIREKVFDLQPNSNDTNIHDIPCQDNKFNPNENISIKTTGSNSICCGDILRFYNYDFRQVNTIIVISYKQIEDYKIIQNIYEIDYNKDCHNILFGNISKEDIEKYVKGVKSIPLNVKGSEAKNIYDYLNEKKKLSNNNLLQINPKVDSKQSRVQCSIPKFKTTLEKFIRYMSPSEYPNIIRNKVIELSIQSYKRKRNKFIIIH
jgi:hypothetical protein